jgi:hypothetical protein
MIFILMRQKYLIIETTMLLHICMSVDSKSWNEEDVIYIQSDATTKSQPRNRWQTKVRQQESNLEYVLTHEDTEMSQRVRCQIKDLKCYHMITFVL